MKKKGKSLAYFKLTNEREAYNKLNVNPKPESLIRLAIHVKKTDDNVEIKPQQLTKFDHHGLLQLNGVVQIINNFNKK